jgi:hypothetical protein
MEKILTAKEFLIDKGVANPIGEIWRLDLSRDCYAQTEKDIHTAMIEFAKLHVEAALKQAAHESQCYNKAKFPGDENWVVDIESILNSYPSENIK